MSFGDPNNPYGQQGQGQQPGYGYPQQAPQGVPPQPPPRPPRRSPRTAATRPARPRCPAV